jgi:RHS repeat-associated protein
VKKTGQDTTYYFYDGEGRVLGEYDRNGNAIQETVYLNNMPVVVLKPEQGSTVPYYIYADHINTPRVITRASDNSMVWRWDNADPFGALPPDASLAGAGAFGYNPRFPGQLFDSESGFHYNYFRDYDPKAGRYLQSDPIGLNGGVNTYAYVGGNPVWGIDPYGLAEVIVWEPVGRGSSSFGHVSTIANGKNYSWGTGGWDTNKDPASYIDKNRDFRSGIGVKIKMTQDQENRFEACLKRHGGSYNLGTNNCGTPSQNCLREVGINDFYNYRDATLGINGNYVFPVDLGNGLLSSPSAGPAINYPAKNEPSVLERLTRAPWAWGL